MGPGLGHERERVARILEEVRVPLVLDADGLNSICEPGVETQLQGRGVETVLTPHPGEMARLLPVFHHNAIDILTLACLTAIVPRASG